MATVWRSALDLSVTDAVHSWRAASAINVGALESFGRLIGRGPDFVNEVPGEDLGLLARRSAYGPIFLYGGDIWPHHSLLREKVVERFPNRSIVQFPQSVRFSTISTAR